MLEGVDKRNKKPAGMTSSMEISWNEHGCSLDINKYKLIDDPVQHGRFQLLASSFELFPTQVFDHV